MNTLEKILNHTIVFKSLYLAFIIPPYLLPYVRSNSEMIKMKFPSQISFKFLAGLLFFSPMAIFADSDRPTFNKESGINTASSDKLTA